MASEERKAADAKIEEENLFLSLGAGEQQAETDAFQCGRCKQVWKLLFERSSSHRAPLTSEEMSLPPSPDTER
jgi:hypothetical protein